MIESDKKAFKDMINAVFTIYSKPLPEKEMLRIWWHKLERFDFSVVGRAFDKWTDTPNKLPQPADIVSLCKPHEEVYKALTEPVNKLSNKTHSDEVIKYIADRLTTKTDYRAWAKKIVANPKRYPDISLRYAKQALNTTESTVN